MNVVVDMIDLATTDRMITTDVASRHGSVLHTPITVTFKGSLRSVFELTKHLNQRDPIIRLQRIEISRDPEVVGDVLSVSLSIDTFTDADGEAP
jgi:hypothetical protein